MNILAELSRVEGVPIAGAARIVMDQLIEITQLTAAESNDEVPRLEQEHREMRIALAKVRLNRDLTEAVRTRRVAELELHIALPQAARLEKQWHGCLDEFADLTRRLRLNHDLTVEVREGRIDEEREGCERALLRKALRARGIRTKRSVDLLRRVPTNAETTRRWEEHCQLIVFERECIEESDDFTELAALETRWRASFPTTKLTGPAFHRRLQELLKLRGYEPEPVIRKRARGWLGLRLK